MKQSELKKVKKFYEETIQGGIIRPIEINEVYCYIFPEELNPMGVAYKLKQRAIAVFVQNKQWEVLNILEDLFTEEIATDFQVIDSTQVASTTGSAADTSAPQSHSEDDVQKQIDDLLLQHSIATDANQKRSISKKINNLKKQL